MNKFKLWTLSLAAFAAAAAAASAGDWHRVGDYTTGGGAKEMSANYQNVRTVQIQCLDGGVNIQTLWVRNGGQKQEIRIARSFTKGEKYNIDLGGRDITGFRVSDSGNGRYRVHVLTDGHQAPRHDDRDRYREPRRDDRYDRDRDYYRDRDRYNRDYDRYDRDYDRRPPPPPRRDDRDRDRDRGSWWWPW